jgi:hypothetical protein
MCHGFSFITSRAETKAYQLPSAPPPPDMPPLLSNPPLGSIDDEVSKDDVSTLGSKCEDKSDDSVSSIPLDP